jgi:hypothetical protein
MNDPRREWTAYAILATAVLAAMLYIIKMAFT